MKFAIVHFKILSQENHNRSEEKRVDKKSNEQCHNESV